MKTKEQLLTETYSIPKMSIFQHFLALIRIISFLLWAGFCIVLVVITAIISRKNIGKFYRLFHRGASSVFGHTVKVHGVINKESPVLYLFNHISYLDISAIGGFVDGYFVAKAEVAKWPVLGHLSKVQNTIFIERNPRKAREQVTSLASVLKEQKNLMIFPEGTSTPGTYIAPIKSSLIAAALEAGNPKIQPVCLVYNNKNGLPMTQQERDTYTWYGDMPFFGHFWYMAGQKGVHIDLIFGPLVQGTAPEDRKLIAEEVQTFMEMSLSSYSLTPLVFEKPIIETPKKRKTKSKEKTGITKKKSSSTKKKKARA